MRGWRWNDVKEMTGKKEKRRREGCEALLLIIPK